MAIELILQAAALLAPRRYALLLGTTPPSFPDPRLGSRPNPDYPERDKRGFRNASTPSHVAIVGMGDSQTYGDGVRRDEAWPQQLEILAGQPVYNMGYPGWGPTQSLQVFDEALALKPRLIIEAFYSGNDLFDSFANVYYYHQLPELKTTSAQDSSLIAGAEAGKTLRSTLNEVRSEFQQWTEDPAGHVKIYQMVLLLRDRVRSRLARQGWESAKRFAEALGDRDINQVVERGDLRTILTPRYRWALLNLSDPRVAEGLHIALEALKRMKERADAAHVEFLVLLIPTKELVYQEAVLGQPDSVSKVYTALLEYEAMFRQRTHAFLDAHGIKRLDVLEALRARVWSRPGPYPASGSHPTASGQRAIAEATFAELQRLGLARRRD